MIAGSAVRSRIPGREVPLLPETVECRPLRGHTVTLERAYGSNRLQVVRRRHGQLQQAYPIPAEPGCTPEETGRVIAGRFDARYLPPHEAAAIVATVSRVIGSVAVATMLDVSVSTVQRWTRAGTLINLAPVNHPYQFRAGQVLDAVCPGAVLPLGRLLSPGRAARVLEVHPATVRKWTASGYLPSVRLASGQHRCPEDDVRALADARKGL